MLKPLDCWKGADYNRGAFGFDSGATLWCGLLRPYDLEFPPYKGLTARWHFLGNIRYGAALAFEPRHLITQKNHSHECVCDRELSGGPQATLEDDARPDIKASMQRLRHY
jgi:hypothetical protein